MTRFHALGIVIGLVIGGFAIQAGCPQFFTAHHAEMLRESMASD
jgi:hypothetical protein